MRLLVLALILSLTIPAIARAQNTAPYDPQLARLAEVLGSLHFLRRICNPSEGQVWRDAMAALLEAEVPSAQRRQRLLARFNRGFAAFNRTYVRCTPAAIRAAGLYQAEGTRLASQIVSRYAR